MYIEYVKKSRNHLDNLNKNAETIPHCIERLCAYVNNNRRFVELLKEKEAVRYMFICVYILVYNCYKS